LAPRTLAESIISACHDLIVPDYSFRNQSVFVSALDSALSFLSCSQGCSKFNCFGGKCEAIVFCHDCIFYPNTTATLTFRVQLDSFDDAFSSLRVCVFQDCAMCVVRDDPSVQVPLNIPSLNGRHVVDVFTTDGNALSGFPIFVQNPPEISSIQSLVISPGSFLKFRIKPFQFSDQLKCFFGTHSSAAVISDSFQCTCKIPIPLIGIGLMFTKFGNSLEALVNLGMFQLLSSELRIVSVKPSAVSPGISVSNIRKWS